MTKTLLMLLVAFGIVAGADPTLAQGRGHGPKYKDKRAKVKTQSYPAPRTRDILVIDREGHRRVIGTYYNRQGLPPGLAKREDLPPGLRKQLRERGALPPGLEKRWVAVPLPLVRRLPAVPRHYERYFVDRDLIVVDRQRNMVLGIIPDVLPPERR